MLWRGKRHNKMKELHREYKELVIRPTLTLLERHGFAELNSPEAVNLLYGTALAETGLRVLVQDRGPALGYYQIEPEDHDDIWLNWIDNRRDLKKAVIEISRVTPELISKDRDLLPGNHPLVWNLSYATLMCRIHYSRQPGDIPSTVEGQATYWLHSYNRGGRGSIDHYMEAWKNG